MHCLGRGIPFSVKFQTRNLLLSSWSRSSSCSAEALRCDEGNQGHPRSPKIRFLHGCSGISSGVVRGIGRVSAEYDEDRGFSTSVTDDDELVEYEHLCVGFDEFKSNDVINSQLASNGNTMKREGNREQEDARNMAIGILASRAVPSSELRKKLSGRNYSHNVIESVIADLRNRGMVNDEFYAESFCRSRFLTNTWGPRRIKRALLEKGVSEKAVYKATSEVFTEGNPVGSGHDELPPGMSQLSLDHLFTQASKQWLRYGNKSVEKQKSGMLRWLQYRGFDWVTIKFILKKLEKEHPS